MRTTSDRIRQAVGFEVVGLAITAPLFSWLFDHPFGDVSAVVIIGATTATLWNYVYNLVFDHLMHRATGRLRKTLPIRLLHAILFETTLLLLLLPLFAWWLGITLLEAFLMDIAFAAFYVVYAFGFTWVYDILFPMDQTAAAIGRQ